MSSDLGAFFYHRERGFLYTVSREKCAGYADRFKDAPWPFNPMGSGYSTTNKTGCSTSKDIAYKPGNSTANKTANSFGLGTDYNTDTKTEPLEHSSSSNKNTTTYSILTGPEMAYWEELGLQEKQTLKWCQEFDVEPGDMRQQLAWARWDLVCNGKEEEIKSPVNWFYGVMRKTAGCYPPPKNYQTPAEIRAGRLKTQRESEQRALQDLATEEVELRFKALLADPAGMEYQQLLLTVPELARNMKGKAMESILRERFFAENREG